MVHNKHICGPYKTNLCSYIKEGPNCATKYRRYGPLREPSFISWGGLWPLVKAFWSSGITDPMACCLFCNVRTEKDELAHGEILNTNWAGGLEENGVGELVIVSYIKCLVFTDLPMRHG